MQKASSIETAHTYGNSINWRLLLEKALYFDYTPLTIENEVEERLASPPVKYKPFQYLQLDS